MNLKEVLSAFKTELEGIYDPSEILSIFYLVAEELTGLQKSRLFILQDTVVDERQIQKFYSIAEKLKQGIPLQYVLGYCFFYGLKFNVNPSVLIPRPETEELVDWVIDHVRSDSDKLCKNILDIGTGSGCIAIALKTNLEDHHVSAIDVSDAALQTASLNAEKNNVGVDFILADIRDYHAVNKYDVIVSNPPYITDSEKEQMHQNVLDNEPHLALFVKNEDPLEFYEAIAKYATQALKPNGSLFFEINELFGEETINMLRDLSFKNILLKKDMQGKDRMIYCTFN